MIDTSVMPINNESNAKINIQEKEQTGKSEGRTFAIVNAKKPMLKTLVREYKVDVDQRITDLFKLSSDELLEILKTVNDEYKAIEESEHPAAGYDLHFQVLANGKRPIKVIFKAYGERKAGSKMEMPMPKVQDKEGCAFCQNTKVMPGYEDAATDFAHVIESLEGNPLVISNKHAKHFFDQSVEEQRDMIDAAIKVIKIYTQEKCSRFSLFSHVGIEGGQTFPHAHIHSLGSFFKRQSML